MTTERNESTQMRHPDWQGFNLLDFFWAKSKAEEESDRTISEDDCRWIRDWGFNFIRLPMDYRLWIDSDWRRAGRVPVDDTLKIKESVLAQIDRSIELARKYNLHVNLNFHRGPGFCVSARELEPFVLWSDPRAEDAFTYHWEVFAKRYRGIPSSDLSFNLLNEPSAPSDKPDAYMKYEDHTRVMTRAIEAIRAISPDRLIVVDGYKTGNWVVKELIPLGVVQSCRAYYPHQISHYRTQWVDKNSDFPEPHWPMLKEDGSVAVDRAALEEYYAPWIKLSRQGIGVHCGEGGGFNVTPHKVFMAWFTDVMDVLSGHGIGMALWNFRGAMGVIDSGRNDVVYQDWHGHKLDRALLDLLRRR